MNVILLMTDTYRRDNLSCYGPTPVKTPRLDAFAQESYVFDRAYLGSFPTLPNRLDIMSGRFSHIDSEWCPLPGETVTLQQILSASGVITHAIYDNPHLTEMGFNYERGFDSWEWIRGQETDAWRTAKRAMPMPGNPAHYASRDFILKHHVANTAWWQGEEDRFAARSVRAACDWLEQNQDQDKFFLYLDLFDPHEPWDPPRRYIDLYAPEYDGEGIAYPDYRIWHEYFTSGEMDVFRALYRAEASMVDHWFGVLLDKLQALGLDDDTAVIFTSDHGYLFGEHDIIGKSLHLNADGRTAWEAVPMYHDIRSVPLMIRLPGQRTGRHLPGIVQSPDLMPTILEMAGLVASDTIEGQSRIQALQCGVFYTEGWLFRPETVHGRSLLPLMRGEVDKLRDIAVCSNTLIEHTPILAKTAIVTEDGWCLHYAGSYGGLLPDAKVAGFKVIAPEAARTAFTPMLFCLPDDPGEDRDVYVDNRALAGEIHERYVAWLHETGTPAEHLAGRMALE